MTKSHPTPDGTSRRVLLIINSPVGPTMSGPGIRYVEFAQVLSGTAGFEVTLATVPGIAAQAPTHVLPYHLCAADSEGRLYTLAANADVVVIPGAVVSHYPSLQHVPTPLVLDLCTPLLLEELQRPRPQPLAERALLFDRLRRDLCVKLSAADFIICASEKQRDYWLGALSAVGRVNPYTHIDDPTLRRLIDVVPFGLPSRPPRHSKQVLKGMCPGIEADDKVLLWFGGLYDWFDAPTLIRAMGRLAAQRPDIKLFCVQHPNPLEGQRHGTQTTLTLASELGLTGRTVIFHDWVPYAERGGYLLEADAGVSLHQDHLETRFSFRTRFLDYLWAGLPVVATRGDVLSEQVEKHRLGYVIEPGDVSGLVQAIQHLVDTPDLRQAYRPRFEEVAAAYRWEVVTRPLVAFCKAPYNAPDKSFRRPVSPLTSGPTPWWLFPGKAWRALAAGGIGGLIRQIREYRRWTLNRRGKA